MESKIIEWLCHVRDLARKSHGRPEFPVSAHAQAFVCAADAFIEGFSKNDRTSVGHRISAYEIISTFFLSVGAIVRRPADGVDTREVKVRESVELILSGNTPRAAIRKGNLRVGIEDSDQAFEQLFVGIVIGLGDPDVLAAREADAFIPLPERAAGIGVVDFDSYSRVARIRREDQAAVVGGAVVEQNDFEILERLLQDAIDALAQKARVIVIRYDDAYFWHGSTLLAVALEFLLEPRFE